MTEEDEAIIRKMMKQSVDDVVLQIRQEIVNARRVMVTEIDALKDKLKNLEAKIAKKT